jgi:hypothetical protein
VDIITLASRLPRSLACFRPIEDDAERVPLVESLTDLHGVHARCVRDFFVAWLGRERFRSAPLLPGAVQAAVSEAVRHAPWYTSLNEDLRSIRQAPSAMCFCCGFRVALPAPLPEAPALLLRDTGGGIWGHFAAGRVGRTFTLQARKSADDPTPSLNGKSAPVRPRRGGDPRGKRRSARTPLIQSAVRPR